MSASFLQRYDVNEGKSSKGVILVDMDNTIVDYSSAIAPELKKIYPTMKIDAENWQTLKLNDLHLNRRKIQSRPNFFSELKPIPGALEALRQMEKEGYTVFIVSSPSVHGTTCHSEKSQWLKEHMNEKWAKRLVLTKDKTIVRGDVLIDDKPFITGTVSPNWKHITFSQPYNRHLNDEGRIHLKNWENWESSVREAMNYKQDDKGNEECNLNK